jgi:AbrB family looped-hinge helix DNA binding protein
MTKTYYTRRLDTKGRLVIPCRFRQVLKLNAGDELSFSYENDYIIIKKCNPTTS